VTCTAWVPGEKPSTTVDAKKRLICGAEMGIKMVIFFDVYQKYQRMT
jgi:hypothetical protein